MNQNPFEDNVVFEPREASRSVPGLNDQPLAAIIRQFERLEAEPYPRRYPVNLKAQLVTSPEPGYGKSHLIGRLFRALKGRCDPNLSQAVPGPRFVVDFHPAESGAGIGASG